MATVITSPETLPLAKQGVAFDRQLSSKIQMPSGVYFNSNFVYVISTGALPPGLTMTSKGRIYGVPTRYGEFNFTVRVDEVGTGVKGFKSYD